MHKKNRFNLADEPWIPVTNFGLASLKDIFANDEYRHFGGTAREKIALFKLLEGIAQAAATPADKKEWRNLGADGLAKKCLEYLDKWHDAFYLYGEKPFLQMPAVAKSEIKSYGYLLPEVGTGNTTRLTQFNHGRKLADADLALLIVCQMSLCLGGKQTDKKITLSQNLGYEKKSAPPGPGVCATGLLHSFLTGQSLRETVWLNVLTKDVIDGIKTLPEGVGTAPWEKMPETENCPVAENLKKSLMGRLVPMARFCLLDKDGIHYVEGIRHPNYQEGVLDPSAAINEDKKTKPAMLWTDPEKRPWRSLTALLGFQGRDAGKGLFTCMYLREGIRRLDESQTEKFGIWSGGLKFHNTTGEQKVAGTDDNVESEIILETAWMTENWIGHLTGEMKALETMAAILYKQILKYCIALGMDKNSGAKVANIGTGKFWERGERLSAVLNQACSEMNERPEALLPVRRKYMRLVKETYNEMCPNLTGRQMKGWAINYPDLGKVYPKEQNKIAEGRYNL